MAYFAMGMAEYVNSNEDHRDGLIRARLFAR